MDRERTDMNKRKIGKIAIDILLVVVSLLIIVIFCNIFSIHEKLGRIQDSFQEVETPEENVEIVEEEIVPEEVDYIGSIGTISVGKPVGRSYENVITRLKELAEDYPIVEQIYQKYEEYPKKLLVAVANNPEMADFVHGYLDKEVVEGGLTTKEMEQEYPLFLQWDPRWGYQEMGSESCVGLSGCGPTCMSMVLYYLTKDETLTPGEMAEYTTKSGYYVEGAGTAWAYMEEIPILFGVEAQDVAISENAMKEALDNDSFIICAMRRGDFTLAGHFIVIYGYDEEGFLVNDPNCIDRSRRSWSYERLKSQIKKIWAYKCE